MPEGAATPVALKDVGRRPIVLERSDSFGVGASAFRTRTWWKRGLDRHGQRRVHSLRQRSWFDTRGNQAKPT